MSRGATVHEDRTAADATRHVDARDDDARGDRDSDLAPPARPRRDAWPARWAVPVLLVLVGTLLVGLHVRAYTQINPIDETQHIGYLVEAPGIVVRGDLIDPVTMEEVACRGIDAAFRPPPCGDTPYVAAEFPESGYNTAYIHPPTYYALTAAGAAALSALTGADSIVTTGRLVGAVWLALGLLLVYAAGRLLGAGRLQLLGPLLLVASTVQVLRSHATVNPDAASLAVGAYGLLAVVLWTRWTSRWRWLLLVLAGLAAEAFKVQNLLVLIALALFLLLPAVLDPVAPGARGRDLVRRMLAVAALGLPAAVTAVGWTVAVGLLASVPAEGIPMNTRLETQALGLDDVLRQTGTFLAPLDDAETPPPMSSDLTTAVSASTTALLLAGLLAACLFQADRVHRALGLATAAAGLLGAPFLVVVVYVTQGQLFVLPERYALTLVPLLVVLLAPRLTRGAAAVVAVGGAAAVVTTAVQLALL